MAFVPPARNVSSDTAGILKRKKVLVIDDFLNFRITVRNMLVALGMTQVDEAFNGEEAVRKMALRRYDIVLCDYNLGAGKDGQQVLEEVKHRRFIGYGTVYMMVTAENTLDMVMGVAECEPDDYLMKPFTRQMLEKKLLSVLNKKNTLQDIVRAMDDMDYERALPLCDAMIAQAPNYLADLLRIKGEILIKNVDYEAAEQFFANVVTKGKFPWAVLGLGKCRYMKGDYEQARQTFEELIQMNDKVMAAYDWLAKTQERLGNLKAAQATLVQATDISPKAIHRQKELGTLAYRNHDLKVAETAFKSVVKQGKYSYFKKPSDYTNLAKVLTDEAAHQDGLAILGEAAKEFREDPEAALEIALAESHLYKTMNKPDQAREAVKKVMRVLQKPDISTSADVEIELAKALILHGEEGKGRDIVRRLIQSNHEDEVLLEQVKEMFTDVGMADEGLTLLETAVEEVVSLNNEGVKLVQQGDLETARNYFEKAAEQLPDNKIINANAAYAFMLYMKKHVRRPELLQKTKAYLELVYSLDPEYKDLPRLIAVYREFTKEPLSWMSSLP